MVELVEVNIFISSLSDTMPKGSKKKREKVADFSVSSAHPFFPQHLKLDV